MNLKDIIYLVVILAGTGYMLYRLIRKKKGGCGGCSETGCGSRK